MPDNVDYDHLATFATISPTELFQRGNNLKPHGENVANSIDHISDIFTGLQLGWAGKTADEAQELSDRWNGVLKDLFGTKENPEKGVLNAIIDGLLTAAGVFDSAEVGIAQFFNDFHNALGHSGSGDSGQPESITDPAGTAISERW
jgi:hypothetical protein